MERRTFVRGACGLTLLVGGQGMAGCAAQGPFADAAVAVPLFTTGQGVDARDAVGPCMRAGIELCRSASGVVATHEGTELFVVDELGADLVRLADGTRTVEELSCSTPHNLLPVDVASFFVELAQAGYLAHPFYVNLIQVVE